MAALPLLMVLGLAAQAPPPPAGPAPEAGKAPALEALPARVDPAAGAFAALSVPDLAACAAWYRKAFGLTPGFSYRSPDGAVQILVLSRPGLALELQQHTTAQPLAPPAGKAFLRHGLFKVGIQVLDTREAVARLEAAGATVLVRPFEDQGGRLLSAVVQDPFGHTLQIIQPLQARTPRP